jgi:hypothetical protein
VNSNKPYLKKCSTETNQVKVLHKRENLLKKQDDKAKNLKRAYKPVIPEDLLKQYYKSNFYTIYIT